ncbi:STAS domain-containing protein [Fibrella sp. WM1]|uniref:Sulfate transporter/antisigma-factor antagonist STAS n=1 Tax=Fibrella aestuarina BUZ 2 TaxID=1166018 RepID=I0KB68_9BACT|nr:STAS domain-containing protein [Fibrella aestuarina]CCH01371.1 sulfate transporter/antisigma-factor antagonist STAS [Fibrella aestuarina BUZ 2]
MEFTVEKTERYALLRVAGEGDFTGESAGAFETTSRGLFREGFSRLIVDLGPIQTVDQGALLAIKKINRQCSNELGLLVLVTKNDELTDELEDARIADLTILPTVEEAIDAVFLNELENDFGNGADDEYDGELDESFEPER